MEEPIHNITGYLPESSYNSRVREILDNFEQKALYYCDAEYFDEEEKPYKHFDICKSYPNVLIKNSCPVPVYSIHNKIEEFNGVQLLGKNRKILYKFGNFRQI